MVSWCKERGTLEKVVSLCSSKPVCKERGTFEKVVSLCSGKLRYDL